MKVCMIVPKEDVKGGIATVVNGYRKYGLGKDCEISFVESYCDGNKWEKLWKALSGYFKFCIELFFRKPDIVHVHSSFGPSFYRKMPFIYLSKIIGIKLINHIHGAEFDDFYTHASERKRSLIRKVYDKCDVLIVLSDEWKIRISQIVEKKKIQVVENYCHIPEMKKCERKNQILFLGEIGERKGCYDIPEIYQKIMEQCGNITLIMAGAGEEAHVKSMFQERNVLHNVMFPGWIRGDEKEKLLQQSKFFLFPSYNEGMPMAVLEAMAYGMGIVTSNVGGIPKLIEDGINGYLCNPGDVSDISKKMISLIENEERYEKCSTSARKKAIERYSFESHVKKIIEVYSMLS